MSPVSLSHPTPRCQVRSLSSYLELDGFDRTPFDQSQLQSFHRHVTERLEQEKRATDQTVVR